MTIGLAGLGNIGFHFASNLLAAGEDLVVYDVNGGRLASAGERGARGSTGLRDLASQAETVILSLPMPALSRKRRPALVISLTARRSGLCWICRPPGQV
jgi:3-hydroxyisobutyrate dehydrogenase